MKIQNKHNKRLTWDEPDFIFTIDSREIIEVTEKQAKRLLINPNITEVKEVKISKESTIRK